MPVLAGIFWGSVGIFVRILTEWIIIQFWDHEWQLP